MYPPFQPLQLLLVMFAGWVNRHQLDLIAYLQEENRVLTERLGGRRIRFTDTERCRLARKAHILGRKVLNELHTLVTPDTHLRWYREMVTCKWNYSHRQGSGRPRVMQTIVNLVLRMALENRSWGVVVRIYSIATVDVHAKPMWHHKSVIVLFQIVLRLLIDLIALTALAFRQRRSTAAEILVLRRQIALYKERGIKPRRIDPATRISLALLSRFFNWRDALAVVRPETMIRWHRAGWKLFWRLKSRPGRPPIPPEIQTLIRRMANENPSWGEERIANE